MTFGELSPEVPVAITHRIERLERAQEVCFTHADQAAVVNDQTASDAWWQEAVAYGFDANAMRAEWAA